MHYDRSLPEKQSYLPVMNICLREVLTELVSFKSAEKTWLTANTLRRKTQSYFIKLWGEKTKHA